MSALRHKPIDFAAEGSRLALSIDRNCGIRVKSSCHLEPSTCLGVNSVRDLYQTASPGGQRLADSGRLYRLVRVLVADCKIKYPGDTDPLTNHNPLGREP